MSAAQRRAAQSRERGKTDRPPAREPDPRRGFSLNCRRAQGEPNRTHVCTGGTCECRCHAVPPPEDFRALVEQAKEEAR